MRRILPLLVLGVALVWSPDARAKFGISKTKVKLGRVRPPDVLLLGDTASVEVTTRSRRVTDRQLDAVRSRMEDALKAQELQLATGGRADNVVRVSLEDLEARVDERIVYETKYVKIGERQEWNAKKNKYETKDVYGNREEPVRVHTARGSMSARIEADTPGGERTASARADYSDEWKGSARIPLEATSEDSLERYLVEVIADRAAGAVSVSPDPLEALLAVDGDLKNGNRLAEAGMFQEALGEWNRKVLKGDKEAARQHNIGVAHEALAYKVAPHTGEHQAALERAAESYKKALALDPGEKYFTEPNERIQVSLGYATMASRQLEERRRFQEQRAARKAAPPPPPPAPPAAEPPARARKATAGRPAAAPPAAKPPAPPRTPPAVRTSADAPALTTGLGASASLALPLRNGSFEGSLAPWTAAGNASVIDQAGRGKVLEAGSNGSVAVTQAVLVDIGKAAGASMNLQYKVSSGHASVRVALGYEDAQGLARTANLEVTGDGRPGSWTDWSSDLSTVRPRPARVREVRILVDGGTVLLDNVALTLR